MGIKWKTPEIDNIAYDFDILCHLAAVISLIQRNYLLYIALINFRIQKFDSI